MKKPYIFLALIFIIFLLGGGCQPQAMSFPETGLATNTPLASPLPSNALDVASPSAHWEIVSEFNEHHNIMTAGFLDEEFAITGGVIGEMYYTADGGETWLEGTNQSDCRYGMEIVDRQIAWTCGGMTHVRFSKDGGKNWQEVAPFGDYRTITSPCHSMSFHDDQVGWAANSESFGYTMDGAQSWQMQPLPEEVNKIATLDSYAPGEGFLLDQKGVLFSSQDNGQNWTMVSRLPLGKFRMPKAAYQMAAMRFSDAENGIVVAYLKFEGTEKMEAFTTSDGGKTWAVELVPVTPGPPYISRNSSLLTVITGPNILTLLRYIP